MLRVALLVVVYTDEAVEGVAASVEVDNVLPVEDVNVYQHHV